MEVAKLELDRGRARELYQAYKKHVHYSEPIDDEIRRAYQLIAAGRMVIRALESVKAAGLKPLPAADHSFPKLALCRADAKQCTVQMEENGAAHMLADRNGYWGRVPQRSVIRFGAGTFPARGSRDPWRATGIVPTPPLHLRPKRGMANYHVLWEAEWKNIVPHDPLLLRRIGRGDLWLVVAQWDLTPVERAALSTRVA